MTCSTLERAYPSATKQKQNQFTLTENLQYPRTGLSICYTVMTMYVKCMIFILAVPSNGPIHLLRQPYQDHWCQPKLAVPSNGPIHLLLDAIINLFGLKWPCSTLERAYPSATEIVNAWKKYRADLQYPRTGLSICYPTHIRLTNRVYTCSTLERAYPSATLRVEMQDDELVTACSTLKRAYPSATPTQQPFQPPMQPLAVPSTGPIPLLLRTLHAVAKEQMTCSTLLRAFPSATTVALIMFLYRLQPCSALCRAFSSATPY